MSELQAGMLAMVYGLVRFAYQNGLVVELVCQTETPIYENFSFDGWTPGDWICSHPSFSEEDGGVQLYDRKNLLPLPPLADPLDQKQQQELHA